MGGGAVIFFTILGNHEDPKGNPIGYTRMTQRGKWVKPAAKRYEAWKDYVWNCLLKSEEKPSRYENGEKIVVSCYIDYKDRRRPDPGNVVKGIADALADRKHRSKQGTWVERRLYPNDRNVLERVSDFDYSDKPGVMVTIYEK
jgi:Holliday junction resolvase RusA-like endonuclease